MDYNYKTFFNEIENNKIKGFAKAASNIESLLIIVISIYLIFSNPSSSIILWFLTIIYILYKFIFYYSKWTIKDDKIRLIIITVAMIIYIFLIVSFTGTIKSPFLQLFYLPLIISTIALNRLIAYAELFAITALYIIFLFFPSTDINLNLFLIDLIPLWLLTILATMLSKEAVTAKDKLEKLSQTDSLTGLWNMRMFTLMAEREHLRIVRNNSIFSIIMLDADNLKDVNDAHGHQAGSKLIQHMGKLIKSNLRATDLVARYGGDEFIIMLPETESSYAHMVAERIRSTIETTPLKLDENTLINISVSIGIASSTKVNKELKDIIFLADKALYDSKKTGKNRTTIYNSKK